ncbi:hypothetical protein Ccel_3129 [Ruminiclostridium cellulolyticum H10]|uniref:Uncharacterized protein n=1 Tax=Ruminiclostridium cellulolyticum (strain ATCC 35319 / DSM 5812 / JCM 6584 / H10) TaxID=394503 RepID=B8I094_RUMCH|nr:hypothetical protein Ccel_3129 [Ruminiclostridium cellulolyticum H10]
MKLKKVLKNKILRNKVAEFIILSPYFIPKREVV